MKYKRTEEELHEEVWMPEASRFGNILGDGGIKYAIFGAGALAVQDVMIRPTIDIDFVVDDYDEAISIMKKQPELDYSYLEKEKDGIQVTDFYFKYGTNIQIWNDNLYSLPMTDESWARIVFKPIGGYNSIWSISKEDLIVSKIGRHTQQMRDKHEANKNANDIVVTMQSLSKPDFKYIIQRLDEGARSEKVEESSEIHNLKWYFVKEVEIYKKMAESLDNEKIGQFIASVLVQSKSAIIEHDMLNRIRKGKSLKRFKSDFMLDEKNYSILLDRWKSILEINDDKITVSDEKIQEYVKSLKPETISEYAKKLISARK